MFTYTHDRAAGCCRRARPGWPFPFPCCATQHTANSTGSHAGERRPRPRPQSGVRFWASVWGSCCALGRAPRRRCELRSALTDAAPCHSAPSAAAATQRHGGHRCGLAAPSLVATGFTPPRGRLPLPGIQPFPWWPARCSGGQRSCATAPLLLILVLRDGGTLRVPVGRGKLGAAAPADGPQGGHAAGGGLCQFPRCTQGPP